MSKSRIMMVVGLLVAGSLANAERAVAQANCDWYAKTALKQQQENERRRCGFTGPAWNPDLKAHMTWCAGATPDQWRSEAQKREQQLASCKR